MLLPLRRSPRSCNPHEITHVTTLLLIYTQRNSPPITLSTASQITLDTLDAHSVLCLPTYYWLCLTAQEGSPDMAITRVVPPLDYLHTASRASLQSFELAHLNLAANLRREIAILIDQWIEETAEAMLARCMLDHYAALHRSSPSGADVLRTFHEPAPDLLPSTSDSPADIAPAPPRFAKSPQPETGILGRKPSQ
jgi:hypothetical protein